jgi:hypothetical protein
MMTSGISRKWTTWLPNEGEQTGQDNSPELVRAHIGHNLADAVKHVPRALLRDAIARAIS